MARENRSQPPQPPIALPEVSQMVSSVKLHILKKGEYILWTMKMEQYLAHTDYALWEVILNGNSAVQMTKDEADNEIEAHPVTTQFHGIKDVKTLWVAIKTRFGGNAVSKKMQKNVLKQQFEIFSVSNSKGLDKGYDRFQRLLSLLEIHRAGIDNLDIDDLYNNVKVYKADIKGSSGSSSNSQNAQGSSSYADELMFLFFATKYNTPQLDNKDLEQINQDDLEEIDLKWQVAMLFIMVKRFYKKTRRKLEFNGKEPIGFDKTKVECYNCHRRGHFARDCRSPRNSRNRSRYVGNPGYRGRDNEEEANDFTLMAFTSNPSSSLSSNSEEEVTETVFDNRSSDEENSLANDMFKKGEGYHVVPLPLTGNYMPPKPDLSFARLDDSIYKFKISEAVTSLAKDDKDAFETSTANVETPKEDRSTGESVKHVKHVDSVKHVNPVKSVKTAKQTKKSKHFSSSPKIDRKDWNGKMTQKLRLGFGFTKKACFVCSSMSHLIKDCTFHKDRLARKSVLPTNVGKGTSHMERRPVWNNVQRINHHNKFAPTAVFTRSGRIPVSAVKPKAAASISAAKQVNTAGPKQSVKFSKSRSTFHKSHSPIRRSIYNATTHSRRNSTERVNTAGSEAVSAVKGNGVTAVKTSAGCVWRPRVNDIDQLSKDNRWICTRVDYGHPQQALKNKRIVDSGCSRDLTCLFTKASIDDSNLWHKRHGHVNFKTMNQLVKGKLVRGLPSKIFENDHTFVDCQKAKQHKATLAVNTACYVLNRALVTKTHNKTPYELLNGRTPRLDFMRPFGCHVTILNTLDPLRKFEGKADEGFLVGYSVTSKAFRVFNTNSIKIEENMHVRKEASDQHYIVLPLWSSTSFTFKSSDDKATDDKPTDDTGSKTVEEPVNKEDQAYRDELDRLMSQEKEASNAADALRQEFEQGCIDQRGVTNSGSTNSFNTVSPTIYASYIEQFWNTATSKTVKSVKQIHAIIDGKAVVISESSVRSDLVFNNEDDIACLTNAEIFKNLALMGYEQISTKLTFQKVSHEPQNETHIEQILPSSSTYQRKHKKTHKHRKAKKVTELPQTSVPLDHGADKAVRKGRVTAWKGLSLL
nr:ribonuclease H-like domain-containing protein [Tanacetum cinerariifolium]